MTCDFTSFSTVFVSYQDDGPVIMKVVCNGIPFTIETEFKSRLKRDLNPGQLDLQVSA